MNVSESESTQHIKAFAPVCLIMSFECVCDVCTKLLHANGIAHQTYHNKIIGSLSLSTMTSKFSSTNFIVLYFCCCCCCCSCASVCVYFCTSCFRFVVLRCYHVCRYLNGKRPVTLSNTIARTLYPSIHSHNRGALYHSVCLLI